MKYRELYERGKEKLSNAGLGEALLDARLLLEASCGTTKHDLIINGDKNVTEKQKSDYLNYISRREMRIPLQYILGEQEFMGLKFIVTPDTLIPRCDTEILVEEVMRHLHDGQEILDMCTGSGCILLSLLHYTNNISGTGVDISAAALAVARKNESRIRSLPQANKNIKAVNWLKSDLFTEVSGQFDIIVANPPYIPTEEIKNLMPEVRDFEPLIALDGKEDGLCYYREIIEKSGRFLYPGGYLFLEIGYNQAEEVKAILEKHNFNEISTIKDLSANNRVIYATKEP